MRTLMEIYKDVATPLSMESAVDCAKRLNAENDPDFTYAAVPQVGRWYVQVTEKATSTVMGFI